MDNLDDSMSLRRSTRRSITLPPVSSCSTPKSTTNQKFTEDGGSGGAVRLRKRVKGDSVRSALSSDGDNTGNTHPVNKSDMESERKSRPKRRKTSESSRPSHAILYSRRMRHGSSGGIRGKQDRAKFDMEPVRRSTREKRLVFTTLNLSEIDKQILDPKHGYPDVDSSEEEMEPYEKLFSPKRVVRKSTRLREKYSNEKEDPAAINKKVKEERAEGDEGKEENEDEDSEQEESEGEEEEEEEEGEEGEEDEGDNSEEEHLEDEAEMTYNLRKRRPVIYQYQPVIQVVEDDTPPKKLRRRQGLRGRGQASYHTKARSAAPRAYQPRRKTSHMRSGEGRKRHVQRHGDSSTTSSGSDSDEARFRRRKARSMAKGRAQCLPMNFAPEDIAHGAVRDRVRIGASLADIDPMNIDRSVTFDSVGGLQHHVRALKEMIIFPLLYPEVFERFKINPPRGVLFYGPPGCGKTLVARALANECSKGGKKVAFFMRKGADCLSKWIGESERQLRLLFDQAYQLRPSIIFFDEIDGLAPVRSSRQDQIHSSIVSTLLALMDGLDSRGEIVVIGATNRIDAIDPALRRPGRFDREFLFPLPSREDRYSILSIHTHAWSPQLKPDFLSELADNSVGYCGADLRALCTEAALFALRRKYPQIYKTTDKLMIDVASINVAASDFHSALKVIVPTAQRSDASTACSIPEHVRPLLLTSFNSLLSVTSFVFPPSWKAISRTAKEMKILAKLQEDQLTKINSSLRDFDTTKTAVGVCNNSVASRGKSISSSCFPSTNKKHTKSGHSVSMDTNNHHGSRMNKVKIGKPPEVRDSIARLSSWSHHQPQQQQQQKYQDRPGLASWSGQPHRSFNRHDSGGVANKDGTAKRRQLVGVVNGKYDDEEEEEEEEGEGEKDLSELFSQLYESSQPSELDQIYFDVKEMIADNKADDEQAGSGRSILLESCTARQSQTSSVSTIHDALSSQGESYASYGQSVTSAMNSVLSQRYLTLSSHPHTIPTVHRPRLILCGATGMGQTSLLSPALLHALEEFPVKTLDLTTVFATSTKSPEEACTQVFREARRVAPSIVYLPRINSWWEVTPETFRATLFSVVYSLPPTTPLLVLATAECPFNKLPVAIKELFKQDCSKVFTVQSPSLEDRKSFFYDILMEKPTHRPPPTPTPAAAVELEVLPVAPPPKPRELNEGEVEKIEKQREAVLRELRVFLRDATNKLLAERKFKEFAKPVDSEEVPDYYKIIMQPMDLGTIMKKIDEHRYTVPKQWMDDVDLITRNALEYNPEHDSESRLLRHRAVALQDMAHSFLDHELSEDFEQQCNEIAEAYKRLGKDPSLSSPLKKTPGRSSSSALSHPLQASHHQDVSAAIATATSIKLELYDAPRRSLRQKGLVPEQTGFPYYSPPRPRRIPHDKSKSAHKAITNGPAFAEGESEGATTEGERSEHESTAKKEEEDVSAVTEVESHQLRRTSGRGQRLRSRESNASESSETKREDSPLGKRAKSNHSANASSPTSSDNANSTAVAGSANAESANEGTTRVLNNTHARRQIIRPWEDGSINVNSMSMPLQSPTLTGFHSDTLKKQPLHNRSTGPFGKGESRVVGHNGRKISNHRRENESNGSSAANSVQAAAEALVDLGQFTSSSSDSQEHPFESMMDLEAKNSVLNGNSTCTMDDRSSTFGGAAPGSNESMDGLVHAQISAAACSKEVAIDRKRLLYLFSRVTEATESASIEQMDRLHSTFEHIVFRHRMFLDKRQLIEDLELAADLFFQTCSMTSVSEH